MRWNRRDRRAEREQRDLPADLWEYLQPFVSAEPHPGPDWYVAPDDSAPTEPQARVLAPAVAVRRLQLET